MKYNIWQNSAWLIRRMWRDDKRVISGIVLGAVLTVAIAMVGIFMPAAVIERITGGTDFRSLGFVILAFAGALVFLNACQTSFNHKTRMRRTLMRTKLSKDMQNKAFTTDYANLEEKPYIDKHSKALEQLNHNGSSTEEVYHCYERLLTNLIGFAAYLALLATVNPLIMAVTAVTALAGAAVRQWVNRWEHKHDDERNEPQKRVWFYSDSASNPKYAKDIRLFGMAHWLRQVYDTATELHFVFSRKLRLRHFAADAVTALATLVREGLAYAFLLYLVLDGSLQVEEFILLFAAVAGFSAWVSGILSEFAALSMHSLNLNRVREYMEYPEKFRRTGGVSVPTANFSLEMKNVSFTYSGSEEKVLENVSLTIKPGEKLAIVGLNGAGKTTLVKLLTGLYDPTEGEVLLNGHDIRTFNRQDYYSLFTAVFQEFNILAVSIADTIAQPLNEGEIRDEARINECLELADLTNKVSSLPNGVDTLLEKNVNLNAIELSGGETQRLMLARALYKNAPILVLDEPTAALDPIAESRMYDKYNELSENRTSIYISHRLASTRFCDRIILVENKGIAEKGTHDELMKQGGKYAELFEIQSKYYQEEVPV